MDNELLKRGAKSCSFDLHWHSDGKLDITQMQLEQLAFFLTTAEREACAKVCEAQATEPECTERAKYCADAIRMRSNAQDQPGRTG